MYYLLSIIIGMSLVVEEGETEETVQNNSEDLDSTDTDNNE